jgi:hypothetical protein
METQEITLKVMEWLNSTTNRIGDFAKEEIPPFIHEFLSWKFFEAAIDASWTLVYIAPLLIFLIFYSKRVWAWGVKYMDESGGISCAFSIIPILSASVISLAAFPLDEIKTMVKIKAAPKVYLIEEAANIIQNLREKK